MNIYFFPTDTSLAL